MIFTEVPDEQAPEHENEKELLLIKQKEGVKILQKLKPEHYCIALDIKGTDLSSG